MLFRTFKHTQPNLTIVDQQLVSGTNRFKNLRMQERHATVVTHLGIQIQAQLLTDF